MDTLLDIALWVIGIIVAALFAAFLFIIGSRLTESDAATLARRTPHVIREGGGCQVYSFETGWTEHYFTRCGDTVTTDRNYTVSCGKNCTRHETETIVTKNNH